MIQKFVKPYGISYEPERWLNISDILVLPNTTYLFDEEDPQIKLQSRFVGNKILNHPFVVITSEADQICSEHKNGYFGILRKDEISPEEIVRIYNETKSANFFISHNKEDAESIENSEIGKIIANSPEKSINVIIHDRANGESIHLKEQAMRLRSRFGQLIGIYAGPVFNPVFISQIVQYTDGIYVIDRHSNVTDLLTIRRTLHSIKSSNKILMDIPNLRDINFFACGLDFLGSPDGETISEDIPRLRNIMYQTNSKTMDMLFNNTRLAEIGT